MAKEEKFLLLSLEEEKAKDLANAINNETARKILNFLSEKEASEHKLSELLNIPASTVHYNIQQLLKANLIEVKDFYWSEKGNKVQVYRVANKLIVIAPRNTTSEFKINIRRILPVALLSFIATGLIYIFTRTQTLATKTISYTKETSDQIARSTAVPAAQETIKQTAEKIAMQPNYALWFLLGSLFVIIFYLVINLIKKRA